MVTLSLGKSAVVNLLSSLSTVQQPSENGPSEEETGGDDKDGNADTGLVKLTKADRRAKLKKMKKEAKKEGKEEAKTEEQQTPQAAVLVLTNHILNVIYISY